MLEIYIFVLHREKVYPSADVYWVSAFGLLLAIEYSQPIFIWRLSANWLRETNSILCLTRAYFL